MKIKAMILAAGIASIASGAQAQEVLGFFGQVIATAAPFCPQYYVPADGTEINVKDNEALYSLLGNTFGGIPEVTFALPTLSPIQTETGATVQYCICTSGVFPERNW